MTLTRFSATPKSLQTHTTTVLKQELSSDLFWIVRMREENLPLLRLFFVSPAALTGYDMLYDVPIVAD